MLKKFTSDKINVTKNALFFLSRAPTHNRSSRPEVFCKKGVLRNFAKFTGKHLCQRLFFNKVAGQRLFFNKVAGLGLQLF